MSWATNAPLKFRLYDIALWNRLTKSTVDLRDGVLTRMQEVAPALFKDLIEAPRPTASGDVK